MRRRPRNTTSARIAFSVISRSPGRAGEREADRLDRSTPAASANDAVDLVGLIAWQFLDLHGDDVGTLRTPELDACAIRRHVVGFEHSPGLVDPERLARRDVPRVAALEVETEVQALGDQRHERDDDHHGSRYRARVLPPAVEVDRRLAAEQSARVRVVEMDWCRGSCRRHLDAEHGLLSRHQLGTGEQQTGGRVKK